MSSKTILGKLHLSLLSSRDFCRYSLMFKSSHLDILNFSFFSLCPFHTENSSQFQFYPWLHNYTFPKTTYSFEVKLTFYSDFLYGRDKVRKNQTLIYLSERFWTFEGYLQKWPKFRGDKWSFTNYFLSKLIYLVKNFINIYLTSLF